MISLYCFNIIFVFLFLRALRSEPHIATRAVNTKTENQHGPCYVQLELKPTKRREWRVRWKSLPAQSSSGLFKTIFFSMRKALSQLRSTLYTAVGTALQVSRPNHEIRQVLDFIMTKTCTQRKNHKQLFLLLQRLREAWSETSETTDFKKRPESHRRLSICIRHAMVLFRWRQLVHENQ